MSSPAPGNIFLRYLRRLGAGSLLISVIIHLVVIIVATFYVVSTVQEKREAKFQGGSGGTSNSPSQAQHRVQMSRQQQNLSTLSQRIAVDSPNAAVSLPDLPDMPGFSGSSGPKAPGGAAGSGGGAGVGAGFGKGPVMPSFGFREANPGGSLIGRLYDLKQLKNGTPTDIKNDPGTFAWKVMKDLARNNWRREVLDRFFIAPTPLYASQIFIPSMKADEAPKAYGVEKQVKPRAWAAVYRGRVSPPVSGAYRFVGAGDDHMVVRLDGRLVLDCGGKPISDFKTDRPAKPAYGYVYGGNNYWFLQTRGGYTVGNRMELRAGTFYDIEVLFCEGPGGSFSAALLFEKEGETYGKDGKGNPVLPVFRVAPSSIPQNNFLPPAMKDGPLWKALPPPRY